MATISLSNEGGVFSLKIIPQNNSGVDAVSWKLSDGGSFTKWYHIGLKVKADSYIILARITGVIFSSPFF